jgi:hypothetical protein
VQLPALPLPVVGTGATEVTLAEVFSVLGTAPLVTVGVGWGDPPVAVTAEPACPATASVPPAMTAGPGATYEAKF